MKKDLNKIKEFNFARRSAIYNEYLNKYYDLFMSLYNIPELNYQENDFIFRKFWGGGKISSFKLNDKLNILGFADFINSGEYNYLDYPTKAQPTNPRGYEFIPTDYLEVDKDIAIGYARYNKKPVRDFVEFVCAKIADVEICLRKNLKALSTPWIIGTTTANEPKVREFVNKLESDDDVLFFEFSEGETKPAALVSGAPYIIDKLYNQKNAYESEILTYFGVNNLGGSEKKEHLITSEIDVNNEVIEQSGDNFVNNIKGWLNRTNKLFNTNLTLNVNIKKEQKPKDESDQDDDGGDNE